MKARAKTLNNKVVEGYVKNCTDTGLDVYWIQTIEFIDYQIDDKTLEYKIGDEWYSMETLEHITEDLDIEYLPKGNYERD